MRPTHSIIGVDLVDKYSYVHSLEPDNGATLGKTRLVTTEQAFNAYFENLPKSRVVLEAGAHSPWLSQLLETSDTR